MPFGHQNVVPADKVYVLRAARILEPATGRLTRDGYIVVKGQCILGINAAIPPAAAEVQLGDVTLLPGLIDLHTHLFLRDEDQVWPYSILWKTSPYRTIEGVDAAIKTLNIGFTTVRDLDDEGAVDSDTALRDAIARGVVPGPQMIVAGIPLSITGGDMNLPLINPEIQPGIPQPSVMVDDDAALVPAVRARIKRGSDLVKIYVTSTRRQTDPVTMRPFAQFNTKQIRTIVDEARRYGRDVAAHGYGGEAVDAAIQGGVRTLEHGPLMTDQNIDALAHSGTYWVPTLMTYAVRQTTDFEKQFVKHHREVFAKALRAGVKIGFGTDVGSFPHGTQNGEFDLMVSYGMRPLDAIRSATSVAATVLRLDGQVGTLDAGSDADIIAVSGNPLERISDIHNVRFVMADGRIFRNDVTAERFDWEWFRR
jgi:imidazolonepropionase-like amidohydrolase